MMRILASALALGLLFANRGSAEECSRNEMTFNCSILTDVETSAPTASATEAYEIVPWQAGQSCPIACYDVPHGRLEAQIVPQGTSGCNQVALRDTFRLVGPAGPSLSFEVVVELECAITDSGTAAAVIFPNLQRANFTESGSAELVAPITVDPNTPFPVGVLLVARTYYAPISRGGAHITGDLRFRGVPPGYAVVSCNGYDLPVPATATSWGRVRALYR
jgi:hypothetical protein